MIWCVIWVVLMVLWLFGGTYVNRAADRTVIVGGTLIPWCCVLILGLIVFGAFSPGPVRF
jgi:hypothetical protein